MEAAPVLGLAPAVEVAVEVIVWVAAVLTVPGKGCLSVPKLNSPYLARLAWVPSMLSANWMDL